KWDRTCAYCGKKDVPFQVEHIHPRARGGTNRISNLTLACEQCNQAKGTQDVTVFLARKPDVLKRLLAQKKQPLKDASAVNATRWALYERLQAFGFPVECGTGGRTKFNRVIRHLPKTHWLDAACIGVSTPDVLDVSRVMPLIITATGHGNRRMCGVDTFGFPDRHKARQQSFMGYHTGDLVKAIIPQGTYAGIYEGRIAIRFRPSFRLGKIDVHPKYLRMLQRGDGYAYNQGVRAFPPTA
ncbi:MAG TPA: HNH endonuclease, partial [Ktedonobacteraceae bacterium]|nr:HNH endonuclease [Ktedonobacteraceae bacterium]